MKKIDFLIIGAQKSGTTTLYDWLTQFEDIYLPETKEILYFAKDEFYEKGSSYLETFYGNTKEEQCVGGAYVHLMYFPQSVERIYTYNQDMKFICVLRNPIDRAYSAYWFARKNGWEEIPSFEEALEQEEVRSQGSYKARAELTYLSHGHYAEQIERYRKRFGDNSVLPIFTEDLRTHPEETIRKVLRFVGLPIHRARLDFSRHSNPASLPRSAVLQKALMADDSVGKRIGRVILPHKVRRFLREKIVLNIIEYNSKPFRYPPMRHETRQRLVEYFSHHTIELEKLTGRDLSHWR